MSDTAGPILAVDWGTSTLRAHLVAGGEVVATHESARGIDLAFERGYGKALRETAGDSLGKAEAVVMCGKVPSMGKQVEPRYECCPCSVGQAASAMLPLDPADGVPVLLAPGLRNAEGKQPDVMWGGATQVFGAVASGHGDGLYVLPGPHTRWVRVRHGDIAEFRTFMTLDVYRAVRGETSLNVDGRPDGRFRHDAFVSGVKAGAESPGELLSELFSTYAQWHAGSLGKDGITSRTLGTLIGAEAASNAGSAGEGEVRLIGEEAMTAMYRIALEALGRPCAVIDDEPAVRGLCACYELRDGFVGD